MRPAPSTLSPAELKQFRDDGYVVVRSAFASADAGAMADEWWVELAQVHGIERNDRSTWRQIRGDLKRAKQSPLQAKICRAQVRGVIDDLLGRGAWDLPKDWGRAIVTFPQPGDWDVPTGLWHWDSPVDLHREALNALLVVSFIGAVTPRGGGTLILSGSHRLLQRQDAALTPAERRGDAVTRRDLFHRADPWLMALTGHAPSPRDRVAAFMQTGATVDGVPLRVVELSGAPGDMVFCHPTLVHCIAPNAGEAPRFMRIRQQLMTHEGRRRLTR